MLVDSSASYIHDKLEQFSNMTGLSNVTSEKFIYESQDEDLKNNFVGVFS